MEEIVKSYYKGADDEDENGEVILRGGLFSEGFHFIQDSTPIHTSMLNRDWFEENMPTQNIFYVRKVLMLTS
jgi:hypothetical protein